MMHGTRRLYDDENREIDTKSCLGVIFGDIVPVRATGYFTFLCILSL